MPATVVIFGASGDLTSRKLVPALYKLHRKGRLKDGLRVVGFSRSAFSHDQWRAELAKTTAKFAGGDFDDAAWQAFAQGVYYHAGDVEKPADFDALRAFLQEIEGASPAPRLYYLSMAPQFYETAVEQLGRSELAEEQDAPRRLVVEKPFGADLKSAQRLNESVHRVFRERQVYRIDHYLG
ncbi:MAG TPA: glucose-6-phosphate dehydrogenase, partial [Lacipirellulaceae bacterium]|nr:glucose-6-phosphate dehydrogenase [Lacipirellulaceae bacterium]